ncbi:hypothetical protein [Polaribacter butkevichii]|uniref:Lipoprotein n=1 Tax=Polaribacter butkevichii TaxID=218490 RepID=A0A2P6C7H7_9FLAO|nr:hypothetical protein [Polaribacter butkevichii]PQJ68888.1 hypothetical protein BTO14_12645 [Polaribacter butkevichii]
MKTIKIILTLCIALFYLQCASSHLEKQPPFSILSSTYYSALSNTTKDTFSEIHIKYTSKNNINFDSLYFRKNKIKLKIKDIKGNKYAYATFKKNNLLKDFTLDANPIKELENPIPISEQFPFNLKENEAVISYQHKGKTNYYKIKNVEKTDTNIH